MIDEIKAAMTELEHTGPTYYTTKPNMEIKDTAPKNYRRSLLAIAELINAIVEEMSEQEAQQSAYQQEFPDEFSATDL